MKKIVLALTFLCSSIFAGTINIAVAANVSYAINELIAQFNKTNPDTKVEVVLGSSGKFVAQIQNGAPFDIFMSADMKFPEILEKENLTATKPVIYAQGSVAMLSAKPLDFSKGIALVANKDIEKISLGKVNAEIQMKLKSGNSIVSIITNSSVVNLGLAINDEVVAVVKSNNVLLSTTQNNLQINEINSLKGNIEEINIDSVNAEVVVNIGNEDKIVAIVTINSIENMNLKIGASVDVIIKASDIMIGK